MNDLRLACRSLAKSPGFTGIAVLSLALGIGASTAIFSVANAILLRSLAVPNPQELRVIQWTGSDSQVPSLAEHPVQDGTRSTAHSFTHPMFLSLRERAEPVADIFGFIPIDNIATGLRNEILAANGEMVSDNFFSALGVRPFLGKLFAPGEPDSRTSSEVVITYAFWERRMAGDPGALGESIVLNGVASTISGVLPRDFDGVRPGDRRDFYVPMSARPQFFKESFQTFTSTRHWWVQLMARLKPAGSEAQLGALLSAAFAHDASAVMKEPRILVEPGRGGPSTDRDNYRRPVTLMLGIVGSVMLVACANLAGLSLARGAARRHELAVRAALGAGRWPLIRLSLAESAVLAALGGALGMICALWGKGAISRLLADSTDGLQYDLSLNLPVLGFALILTLVTALLSGLLPAMRAGSADPLEGLKSRGALGVRRLRVGRVLVAAQMALSLLLITGAGLYLRTLVNLRNISPGFVTEKLLTFQLNPTAAGFSARRLSGLYSQIQASLAAIPGVQGATFVQHPLLANQSWDGGFELPGHGPSGPGQLETHRLTVGEPFFETMGIPMLQGRGFRDSDTENAPRVAVINETFARQYLRGESPLGQKMRMLGSDWLIVGICRDVKYDNIKSPIPATTYLSFRQYPVRNEISFALRTTVAPMALASEIRRSIAAIDPTAAVSRIVTEDALRDSDVNQERLLAILCGALASLALLLSAIGLYGLIAYNVERRTGEFGIRLALGARQGSIATSMVREALLLAAFGIGIGVPAAIAATRLIHSQLYGIDANDPFAVALGTLLLVVAALAAAWVPARRASRIAPSIALRAE